MQNAGNLVMCNIVLTPSPFFPVPFQGKGGPNLSNQALNQSKISFAKKKTLLVFRVFFSTTCGWLPKCFPTIVLVKSDRKLTL